MNSGFLNEKGKQFAILSGILFVFSRSVHHGNSFKIGNQLMIILNNNFCRKCSTKTLEKKLKQKFRKKNAITLNTLSFRLIFYLNGQ